MRRAIAGIVAFFALVAFVGLVPVVPASASSSHQTAGSAGPQCPVNAATCLILGGQVQGYGSLSYYLMGRGAFYYRGNYALATSDNFSITVA
jgi:hypothetical protein